MKKLTLMLKPLAALTALSALVLIGCGSSPSSQTEAPPASQPAASTAPSSLGAASPNTTSADEGRVYLAENRLSFVPPSGFTEMTPDEIAVKFPNANRPQHVYANDRRSVAIAITFSDSNLAPDQLPELKQFMEPFLEQSIPGLQWIDRSFVTINGARWVKLEATSQAIDTGIHNDMYFTSFEGKMLGFNFNSTVEMNDAVRADLLKSRDSIVIQP